MLERGRVEGRKEKKKIGDPPKNDGWPVLSVCGGVGGELCLGLCTTFYDQEGCQIYVPPAFGDSAPSRLHAFSSSFFIFHSPFLI